MKKINISVFFFNSEFKKYIIINLLLQSLDWQHVTWVLLKIKFVPGIWNFWFINVGSHLAAHLLIAFLLYVS